ncbi:hypothetical protein Thiofri_02394 [Thiorhodovibrio frisius]|nr:hypothetical protein Thiofri_02394 [Thiorhodovibrio frisius]
MVIDDAHRLFAAAHIWKASIGGDGERFLTLFFSPLSRVANDSQQFLIGE